MILCKKEYIKKINSAVFPGIQGGPLMHVIAGKAVALKEALEPGFKVYQQHVLSNAQALARALQDHGMKLVSDGTDNHLILIDLRPQGISGKDLQHNLDEVNITTNTNTIPFDTAKPTVTSGLRIGTPALTSRGFTPDDMAKIAQFIYDAATDFDQKKDLILEGVEELVKPHPLSPGLID